MEMGVVEVMYMTQEKEFFFRQIQNPNDKQSILKELQEYKLDDHDDYLKEWISDFRGGLDLKSLSYKKEHKLESYYFK